MLKKLSYSALRTYLSCPLLYWYRYVLKIKLPYKPIQLAFGSALHLALEKKITEPTLDSKKVFLSVFKYEDLFFKDTIPYKRRYYRELITNGMRLLNFYFENYSEHFNEIKSTEQKFKFILKNPVTGHSSKYVKYITGITDYITKDKIIGDYKTSSKKYKQEEIDESLQPTFYYLWYYTLFEKLPAYFEYRVFLKKHKKEPLQIMKTKRTLEDLLGLYHLLEQQSKLIQARKFKRAIHSKYDFCDCKLYDTILKV